VARLSLETARTTIVGTESITPTPKAFPAGIFTPQSESLADENISSLATEYSGVLLSSATKIRELKEVASPLAQQDEPMLDPAFFLASVSKGWAPRVVAVYTGPDVAGILYAKERVISSISTGVVYADGSLGGMLLVREQQRQDVFRVALETLLSSPGIRGVRLRVLRDCGDLDAVGQLVVSRSLDVQYSPIEHDDSPLWKYHAHLPLADSYDRFLSRLGSTTRHNFRYYRRRFEASGHRFIDRLSLHELRSAALALASKSKFVTSWRQLEIENGLNMVGASSRPLAMGLKHRNGEWLSVIGGWYRPRGGVLCFQSNNDCDFGPDSLSIVLRAYLIESLIGQSLEELVIWSDTRPPLSRYVSYVHTVGVRLDLPTCSWRAARMLISTAKPFLPRRLAAAAQWIT
jgi:hypothetical protein